MISVHQSRETAEKALENRKLKLGKKIWECNTRIVWIESKVKAGDLVKPGEHTDWRPGEKIPQGELYSDAD